MKRLSPLPPLPPAPVLTTGALRAAGVSHWRAHHPDLARPIHGVVAPTGADAQHFDTRVAALRLGLREGMFFSRRTAAALLDIPVPPPDLIDIAALRPIRPPKRPQVRGHQLGATVLARLPRPPAWLPEYADAWATLGSVCLVDDLVVAGDYLVSGRSRWEEPACSTSDLRAAARRFKGCTGVGRLLEALRLIRTGVESPGESRTRLMIVRAGFPEPRICCPVRVAGKTLHADLGYPELRIAIEYQGRYHFEGGLRQARLDLARAEAMRAAGWEVFFLSAYDLQHPRDFLARLDKAIGRAVSRDPRGALR